MGRQRRRAHGQRQIHKVVLTPALRHKSCMRPRLHFDDMPAVLYAIGDVHGCLDQLLDLERQIVADAKDIAGEKWLVMLGDYIDRGPASAQVIEHAIAPPPPGWRR